MREANPFPGPRERTGGGVFAFCPEGDVRMREAVMLNWRDIVLIASGWIGVCLATGWLTSLSAVALQQS